MIVTKAYGEKRLAAMEELYKEAFPAAERKPFSLMRKKCGEGTAELLSLEGERGEFQGMAFVVWYQDMVLLDYFAISAKLRGSGVGSEAFRLLRQRYLGKRFFLEIERTGIEAENVGQRLKRKAFYLKNGMTPLQMFVELFGVEMEVLTDGCAISYKEYYQFYIKVFGEDRMSGHIRQIA